MKYLLIIATGLMLVMIIAGCGKKSGLEGKVVDDNGKPMVGVKVVAKQVQPIKGYEQFESTTGADGSFKFGKLFPTSTYELITQPEGTNKNLSIKAESGLDGQTKILPEPIKIRIQFLKDGVTALDTKTGLIWARNANIAGRTMYWGQANEFVKGLDIGGHRDWRLPSKMELEQFVKSAGSKKPIEYFTALGFNNVKPSWYWSGTEDSNSIAWVVDMEFGTVFSGNKINDVNVWPVRSGQ
jgi:hypothetical protein